MGFCTNSAYYKPGYLWPAPVCLSNLICTTGTKWCLHRDVLQIQLLSHGVWPKVNAL